MLDIKLSYNDLNRFFENIKNTKKDDNFKNIINDLIYYIKNDESSFDIEKIFDIFNNYDKEILRSREIHSEENIISNEYMLDLNELEKEPYSSDSDNE